MEMKTLMQRHSEAIRRIGGALALLNLPEEIKTILMGNYDLETKVKMLEKIADAMGK
jgi:hypothetical protein